VDRIAWVGRQDDITRRGDRRCQTGEALLGAHGHDDFALGIEIDAEPPAVVGRLGAAQARDALGLRIAVRARLLGHLAQLVDHVLRGRQIGVAHAQIDDVAPAGAGRGAHVVHLGDDIRWQAADAVEIVVHGVRPVVGGCVPGR
jgi:hypothetical protein